MRCSCHGLVLWSVAMALCGGCRMNADPEPGHRELLVVVESGIYEPLQASIDQYAETVQLEGVNVHVQPWEPGTVDELKALLFEYDDLFDIDGALLVGTLPSAWYEQVAFNFDEEFPMDLYLQDRDAVWLDQDGDGVLDNHSDLDLDFYTSRLDGTPAELEEYFARLEYYRVAGHLVDVLAFVFIDDGWIHETSADAFGLNSLYRTVEISRDPVETTAEAYVAKLTGGGAEFVYQWMHSGSEFVQFDQLNEFGEMIKRRITMDELAEYNVAGSFYNLFNCSAARFDNPNLAQVYTVGTDHGLAILGSTKVGSAQGSRVFHAGLAAGHSWGEAYRLWYNTKGKQNDEWNLGMVIMGDPLLRISSDMLPPGYAEVTEWRPPEEFDQIMERIAEDSILSTFEEYQERHPEFFDD